MWGQHMWDGAWWPWGLLMGIFWLVLFGAIIFLAVYAARQWTANERMAGGPPTGSRRESPREVLDRRYAKGELSREEYEQMKDDLENR